MRQKIDVDPESGPGLSGLSNSGLTMNKNIILYYEDR